MADEPLSLHIDTDWKKQAQEEKRRLAEEQEKQRAAQAQARAAAPAPAAGGGIQSPAGGPGGRRTGRETPQASFGSLVNSILTQAMLHLGELAPQGQEPTVNLDMAKYQVDALGILEDKTKNNLTGEEQHLLDSALYDLRTRFISTASQYI